MNRRIRKKKDKKITEAINGLISIADWQERQRQAAIRQFVKRCEALYEQQRKPANKKSSVFLKKISKIRFDILCITFKPPEMPVLKVVI